MGLAHEQMEVGVQLYPANPRHPPDDAAVATATRALRALLRPFGYRLLKFSGRNPPKLVMMEKAVRNIAGARRERHRIDRVIFGGE